MKYIEIQFCYPKKSDPSSPFPQKLKVNPTISPRTPHASSSRGRMLPTTVRSWTLRWHHLRSPRAGRLDGAKWVPDPGTNIDPAIVGDSCVYLD